MAAPQEHNPARLQEARLLALDILFLESSERDPYDTPITTHEALLMQAISQLLPDHTSFYPTEVATAVGRNPGSVPPFLRKFEADYGILDSHLDPESSGEGSGRGRPRLKYAPTELGQAVFEVFKTEEQQGADLLN